MPKRKAGRRVAPNKPPPPSLPPDQLLNRRAAAELATKEFFPVSVRTIERWPLAWQRRNGRVYCRAEDLREFLKRRLEEAPWLQGGRSKRRSSEDGSH